MENPNKKLFGDDSNVFYIYSPRWTTASAGIRALHFLCHALNESGFHAYLVFADSPRRNSPSVSGLLSTPVLTKEISRAHIKSGRKPIVVYSETVPGNPLKASRVIRYLMNYVGALGGQTIFSESEFVLAYSLNIALDYQKKHLDSVVLPVLFLPAVDPREFSFKLENREDFYLLYAGKYRAFVGAPPLLNHEKVVEIKRHGVGAQTREELIELLSRCRAVISFENSSIITEAILSGAPGLFFPNDFLLEAIAEHELGWGGTGWGVDAKEEFRARSSLVEGRDKYCQAVADFPEKMNEIITLAVTFFKESKENPNLSIPGSYSFFSLHRFRISVQIMSFLGFRAWLRIVKNFLERRLSGRF